MGKILWLKEEEKYLRVKRSDVGSVCSIKTLIKFLIINVN